MYTSFCVHCHKIQEIRIETTEIVYHGKNKKPHKWLIGWCEVCGKKVRRSLPKEKDE